MPHANSRRAFLAQTGLAAAAATVARGAGAQPPAARVKVPAQAARTAPSGAKPMPEAAQRPNFMLIMMDQWRADALSCLGHPVAETPHLDVLAASGTRFTQAYTACPSCIAARAGLLTGMTPPGHGFVGYRDGVDWQYEYTLPRTLSRGGYQTHCAGKMHVHPIRNRVGFDSVDLHNGYLHYAKGGETDPARIDDYVPWLREQLGSASADYTDTGLGCNGYAVTPWTLPERLHPMAWVTARSLDFLRRRDTTDPFFLMTSYHRPHPPLDPPESYLDRFRDKPLPPPALGDWEQHELASSAGLDSPVPHDPVQIDLARRAYYAQLTFLDHQVNRLIMGLSEEGLLGNTWIIFCSDHGDMLFDHKLVAKSQAYGPSAGIPLIVRPPGGRFGQGPPLRESAAVVELCDIFPTCCDLAGLPLPPTVEGRSLLPLLDGSSDQVRPWLHGEHTAGSASNHWLTDGHYKYVWFAQTGRELLFDLSADPAENHNLAAAQPEVLARWHERLAAELADRPEGFVSAGQLVAGRPQSPSLAWVGIGRGG